jgi:transposase
MATFCIGIDIAKLKFDAAIIGKEKRKFHKVFENNNTGFKEFIKWITSLKVNDPHICLEATGIYGEEFTYFLYQNGYRVSVVNPARIKFFGASVGIRNKTDKIDAGVIAKFCQAHDPKLWIAPSSNQHELQGFYRCLQSLQEDRLRITNRLEACAGKSVELKKVWEDYLEDIDSRIKKVELQIKNMIEKDADLSEQVNLLSTIPGVGYKTAVAILSELPDVKIFSNAKEVAAFAGLTPKRRQSGSSVMSRGSLSKIGCAALRKALYMPAIVAKSYNPVLIAFCERLTKKGKIGLVVISAAMRKLLHIIYGVLKNRKPFMAT